MPTCSTRAGEVLATLDRLAPGQRTPFLRATQSEFRARLAAALGGGDADTHFAAAEALLRELQIPFYAARVELQHAEWLIAHERADEAHALLTAARETFERLGAALWLERLEAAEAGAPAETLA